MVCQDEHGFDLVRKLLQTDVCKRLGSSTQANHDAIAKGGDSVSSVKHCGVAAIKAHPFYTPLDWGAVSRHETFPEFIPPKVLLRSGCLYCHSTASDHIILDPLTTTHAICLQVLNTTNRFANEIPVDSVIDSRDLAKTRGNESSLRFENFTFSKSSGTHCMPTDELDE